MVPCSKLLLRDAEASKLDATVVLFCAVGGSVGSGKSSLVAVLTHGVDGEPLLDDGRGKARTAVFRHKHEIQSGHTSSISQSMLGYDSSGKVLNYLGVSSLTATEISAAAQKVLHFIDLCGHSRFLRTALYGAPHLLLVLSSSCHCSLRAVDESPPSSRNNQAVFYIDDDYGYTPRGTKITVCYNRKGR